MRETARGGERDLAFVKLTIDDLVGSVSGLQHPRHLLLCRPLAPVHVLFQIV